MRVWVNDDKIHIFVWNISREEKNWRILYYRWFQGHSSQLYTSESHYHESHQTVLLPKSKQSFMMQQCDSDRSPLEPFYVSPAKLARLVGLHYFSCQKCFFNYTLTFCSIIIAVCESLTADCLPSGSPTQFCVPVKYFLSRLSSVSNLLSSQVICQDNISRLMWCPLIICNNWEWEGGLLETSPTEQPSLLANLPQQDDWQILDKTINTDHQYCHTS